MSNFRKQQIEKISADCPHCGYSQLESVYAKSTICKRCGQHFAIEKLLAKEVYSLKQPSFFERVSKLIGRETEKEIACFSCGHQQIVTTSAESSMCPRCSSYIDLRDFRVDGPFGRTVQTQGEVIILPKGDVTTRVVCSNGRIEGRMRGQMLCTGTLEIRVHGKITGSVEAKKVVIERKCNAQFSMPLKVKSIEIDGKMDGRIYCDGKVVIKKHGLLRGEVHAKSIEVEKGGQFSGDLHIGVPPEVPSEVAVAPVIERAVEVEKAAAAEPVVAAETPAAAPAASAEPVATPATPELPLGDTAAAGADETNPALKKPRLSRRAGMRR